MHRRTFMGAALAAPLAAAGRIRIAFLGASHAHGAVKVQVVREIPDYELVGVCESDPAVSSKLAASGVRTLKRDELLKDPSIRVVAVESQVKDHFADARAALEAGKHVHVEKPPAADMKGLRELLALAARKRLLVQPGYMWRHHPGIVKALEAAGKGWLGEVFMVRGTINTLLPADQRAGVGAFRGGLMLELGCHLIDPMVRLLGRPVKVTPLLERLGKDGLADNTVAMFQFPRAVGVISSAGMHPAPGRHRAFEIFGSNGSAIVRPVEPGTLVMDLATAAGPYKVNAQTVELPRYTRYVEDFTKLAEAVRTGGTLGVSDEQELNVQAAILAASGM